jgi:ABC-type amino acid transport substrate-binding protein
MKNILITILVAALVSFGTYKLTAHDNGHAAAQKESAYDRVMRTHVLRCGYNLWPPALEVDPNTQKITGFIPEMVEYAANAVHLKVEWTLQTGWSTYLKDLEDGRIDAMCAGAWAVKEAAPFAIFTQPIYYSPVYAVVRADDHRFDRDMTALNNPAYKISANDGAIGQTIATEDFPKAQILGLSQLSDPSQVFVDLAYKKSDMVFMEGATIKEFMLKNPGKIRRLSDTPYRSFAVPLMSFNINEQRLATMFDTVIGEMQLQDTVTRMMQHHGGDPVLFVPPIKPYATPR